MINYKNLGYKAFKNNQFEEAKSFFSLAFTEDEKEEILFLISLSEAAKNNKEDAKLIFEFYLVNKDLKENDNFDDLNKLVSALETNDKNADKYEIDENAISYKEFKDAITNSKNNNKKFKENLESIMMSTRLVIKSKDSFLNFIEDLFDNGMYQIGARYFEMFVEIHGSWDKKVKDIAQKIKKYENKINK
ncbi:hypothetical protein CBLAS_1721 [Campylobacter blaseri]|uniref:Histidine kinase n=1 Tax=Campylobacter blaseri TaxID=2042961 RepID=A0A2P8R3V6_9BACT|nr:hypothetical protein [Campylobacter blaseri]PSM53186.1 hypothetical protein CQ405_01160 [Campylobacter blaseri]PSM54652.1 hypothetical protein CRN67_01160 [Campylobacter blaseri]QKF86871.1 hypothetical protein CBLAS_1721 [Campylobacter blaseri]